MKHPTIIYLAVGCIIIVMLIFHAIFCTKPTTYIYHMNWNVTLKGPDQ